MALKSCRECKKKVSTEAASCPNCGAPNPTAKLSKKIKEESSGWEMFTGYASEQTGGQEKKNKSSTKDKKTIERQYSTPKRQSSKQNGIDAFLKGEVDLPLAFWGYGFCGSIIVGLIFGWLSIYSKIFIYLYLIAMVGFYIGLWNCSNRYKEQMTRLNRSSFWGIVVQIMCVLSAIGMLQIFKDII